MTFKKLTKKQVAILIGLFSTLFVILLIYAFSKGKPLHEPTYKMDMDHQLMNGEKKDVIQLSEHARKLAQVEVLPAIRKFVPFEIRLYGKVDYDETRVEHITAWVPGRIEELYVNFTGMQVKAGDPMVGYYSPELIVAQEELLQSLNAFHQLKNTTTSFAKDQSKKNLESARIKLRLLGIEEEQINEIELTNQVKEIINVNAPVNGVVIHKNALEGEYVQKGTEIFMIADLDEVWIQLEAYESDLQGLKLKQKVSFITDAYPGEAFIGEIVFIDPFLDEKTRTANVRVNANNRDRRLKPGMYVTAVVKAYLSDEGKILSQKSVDENPPLVISATAVLITGKRAIVYIQNSENEAEYRLREVSLGKRVGEYYIVLSGIEEGELVVVNGNFKIDSAAQIQAKPSMMSPKGETKPMKMHSH